MTKTKRKIKITDKVKQDIIDGMSQGSMLLDLCNKHNISRSGVWRARQNDEQFDLDFEHAATTGILSFLDDARQNLENANSRDEILKRKEILRHAEWMAEKRLVMFQPMQRSEVKVDGPMVIGWQTIDNETVFGGESLNTRARKFIDIQESPQKITASNNV